MTRMIKIILNASNYTWKYRMSVISVEYTVEYTIDHN
jgi:hypothetical protein